MKLKILGVNAAGIKCKLESFNDLLNRLEPHVWTVQETKLKNNESLKSEATEKYQIYYLNRKLSDGGGLAVGVDRNIESALIREGDDTTEILVVQIILENMAVRIVAGYGPQENAVKEKKDAFWESLEEETCAAEAECQGLVIQIDGNLHAGPELIKSDPNNQNINGKLFMKFLDRNPALVVANTLPICEGTITRTRKVENRTENAILDFLIINEKLHPFLTGIKIDENREYPLCNFAQAKKNKRIIESDHNSIVANFDIDIQKRKPERNELFNLRNKNCLEMFSKETQENTQLVKCLENALPLEKQSKDWLKIFNSILYKCFRKIRVVDNKKQEKDLVHERLELKAKLKKPGVSEEIKIEMNDKIVEIEEKIGNDIADKYHREIVDSINALGGDHKNLNGSARIELWKILNKKIPKNSPTVPVGKKDVFGNIVTNYEGLKNLYLNTYINRLRSRPIKPEFQDIKKLKEELFNMRFDLVNINKSALWTMKDLEDVLNKLKEGKARDPNGWTNKLFTNEVAGKYLKISILILMNKIKSENYIPEFIKNADVTTIYKGKGEKCSLENDRGIFLVNIFRSILMRLIYKDKYEIIDSNMSDSQVGGRKQKSTRNHIWLLNGIIIDVLSSKKKLPIDIQIFDFKQCFDSLWLEDCLNDLYDSGVKDDNLALLYNVNKDVKVAVKTPVGKTTRKSIFNVITQGDVFSPIICSNTVDTIGRECLQEGKYTYSYRGEVDIPPLSMMDDLLCVSECGHRSHMINAYINHKASSKKLQFSANKCKKMHVGKIKEEYKCQKLVIDEWIEEAQINKENKNIEIKDLFKGKKEMEEKSEEKYLGVLISKDGKNIKNIKERVAKGIGIVKRILLILDSIPLGKHYFEVGMLLRDSLLISSILYNAEAWYNISNTELDLIETVDRMFLRKLLNAPKTTATEMFYLELGCLPLRQIIREKRLSFLHYILNEDPKSLINKFFKSQLNKRTNKDWISTVINDLKNLEIKMPFEEIRKMKKENFMMIVRNKIMTNTFQSMEELKGAHSKVKHIEYENLKMQKYLKPNSCKMRLEEAQLIFKLRCRSTNVKMNLKGLYDDLECTACGLEEETQIHIIHCKKLNENKVGKKVNYDKLFNGTVDEKLEIAKIFKENYDLLENMKK